MTRLTNILIHLCRGLALLAMVLYALLPGGGIPERRGPCGRALCNCPPVRTVTIDSASGENCTMCKPAPERLVVVPVLELGAPADTGAPSTTWAVARLDLSFPTLMVWASAASAAPQASPIWQPWAVTDPTYDVSTPPPRT